MKHAVISLIVSLGVIWGCSTQPSGPSATGVTNGDFDDGTDTWFDGNGDPVDQTPDVFSEVDQFILVATTIGGGSVEPSTGAFDAGKEVTLTATPDEGWHFSHWGGDAAGSDPVITLTMVADTLVFAWFDQEALPDDNTNDNDNGNENDNDNDNQNDNGDDEDPVTIDPGSGFESAAQVDLGPNDKAIIEQTLVQASDVHVYEVGDMAAGDRFIATCEAVSGSQLDPLMAVFDADAYRVFWNDDLNLAAGDYDAGIDDLIRHASARCFVAITSTDFAETTGAYRLTIEIERDGTLPQIAGQTIVIDWDGATNVTVAGQNWGNFDPFDAGTLDASFSGQTEALKQIIVSVVEADYAAYSMTVRSVDDPTPEGPYTTVFLGGDSDMLFGIAEQIDFYNADRQDDCIVFAEAFAGLTHSLEAMGQAIGNVISHEVGHDLGLMHTTDVTELMDTTGAAHTLLADQQFGVAEIYDFPIGYQNAPQLLGESIGPAARAKFIIEDGYLRCGTCGAKLFKISDLTSDAD